jgi:uncharacterized protein
VLAPADGVTTHTVIDRFSPRQEPREPTVLRQNWRELLVVHWELDPEQLRRLIPPRLTLDLHEGRAYISLTPFRVTGVRPPLMPPLPVVSRFGEVNVRTYVHLDGADPGVWFFSLDASSRLAVAGARLAYHLPYYPASIRLESSAGRYRFLSRRHGGGGCEATWDVSGELTEARPETLDFFLVERYVLYSQRADQLFRARVHHRPYPLRKATLVRLEEDLLARAGVLEPPGRRPLTHFSPGVEVKIYPPQPVG